MSSGTRQIIRKSNLPTQPAKQEVKEPALPVPQEISLEVRPPEEQVKAGAGPSC